jgi:hypothetical protein
MIAVMEDGMVRGAGEVMGSHDVRAYRRLALSIPGAVEGSHMGAPDFRVGKAMGGKIFATLAYGHKGLGTLMLSPEQQAMFVAEAPKYFSVVAGGWGKSGATLVRVDAPENVLAGALSTAFQAVVAKQAVKKSVGTKSTAKKKA